MNVPHSSLLSRDQRRDHRPVKRRTLVVSLLAAAFAGVAVVTTPSVVAAEKSKKGKAQKAQAAQAAEPVHSLVSVAGGIVQPRRPVAEAITDAIQFLRKADGNYVPGRIDGELAGYFMSALVQADGTRHNRQLSFPARHHSYFIRTFLHYYSYTGEREWLLRARDLADWNIDHSTPADAAYPNIPYSAYQNGKPTGSADKNSTEPDKAAFLGTGYLAVYESTGDARYLEAARKIAATLVPKQREDGSWPFRVVPGDGSIYQDFGGAPVFYLEFFERLGRHGDQPAYRQAHERAARLMIARNVEKGEWGTYHEDIAPKDGSHLSAEPMSFTADYLFTHAAAHPEYIEMGKRVLAQMEAKLVFTEGHAAAPAPAVAEQATFAHIMAGHTARYCLALTDLYRATQDLEAKRRALSGFNAVTYMQSEAGLFRTHFYDTKRKEEKDPATANNWYSQHLYTVCHLLETMPVFPERVPDGQDHIIGSSLALRDVRYAPGSVGYRTALPAQVTMKLGFTPKTVQGGGRTLTQLAKVPAGGQGSGWNFDPKTKVIVIHHDAGEVSVMK